MSNGLGHGIEWWNPIKDHGLDKGRRKSKWVAETKGGVVRAKKQTESETLDHWHAQGGVLLSND